MNVYQVKDWNKNFENSKSRALDHCSFVCVPNNPNDYAIARILAQPDGGNIFAIWILILSLCSRQAKPRNGWLTVDGRAPGMKRTPDGRFSGIELAPHCQRAATALEVGDLAVMLRRPDGEIRRALDFLTDDRIGLILVYTDENQLPENTAQETQATITTDTSPTGSEVTDKCQVSVDSLPEKSLRTEQKGNEQNRTEQSTDSACVPAREDGKALPPEPEPFGQPSSDLTLTDEPEEPPAPTRKYRRSKTRELAAQILDHLNLKTGRQYEKTETNLDTIAVRIEEVDLDTAGIAKMIDRQCDLWLPDERMSQYLRVSTLFNKTKFNEYWSARNMPVINGHQQVDHSKGF